MFFACFFVLFRLLSWPRIRWYGLTIRLLSGQSFASCLFGFFCRCCYATREGENNRDHIEKIHLEIHVNLLDPSHRIGNWVWYRERRAVHKLQLRATSNETSTNNFINIGDEISEGRCSDRSLWFDNSGLRIGDRKYSGIRLRRHEWLMYTYKCLYVCTVVGELILFYWDLRGKRLGKRVLSFICSSSRNDSKILDQVYINI